MIQISEQFQEVERIVFDLHRLMASGQGASEKAHELRNRGTAILEGLSEEEVVDIQRLSAEVQMLNGTEIPRKAPRENIRKMRASRKLLSGLDDTRGPRPELVDALTKRDWQKALNVLREEPLVEPWTRAYLRGIAYASLNRHRTAATFFAFAVSALQRVSKTPLSLRTPMGLDREFETAINAQMWNYGGAPSSEYRAPGSSRKSRQVAHHHPRTR